MLGDLSRYIELQYTPRSYDDATRVIPVSHGAISSAGQQWITVPWDKEISDTENMHSMPGGWSILAAPADQNLCYFGVANLKVQGGVEGCSTHLMPYHCTPVAAGQTDGVDNVVQRREAIEVFVGPNETHTSASGTYYTNTHLAAPMAGLLPAGQRLRVCADYWNAPDDAPELRMVGATVSLYWGYVS